MFKKFIEGFKTGDIKTRLSYVFFGAGSFLRKQYVRGFTFLSLQIIGIIYLINSGFSRIKGLATLGTVVQGKTFDEERGIYVYTQGDNSMLFLLFGVLAVLIIIGLVFLYYLNIKNAIHNQKLVEEGKPLPTFKEDVQDLLDSRFHVTVL